MSAMTGPRRRLLWAVVGVALATLAVTAIVAVAAGDFGGTFWRTIGTVVIIFTCGATALAGNELVHRAQLRPLGWTVLAVAPACAVTLLIADWKHDISETYGKCLLTAGLVLFTGVAFCSAALLALGVPLIWIAHVPDAALKTLLVLIVLVVLGYAATPVVQRLTHRH
jgi:hypothetical protein